MRNLFSPRRLCVAALTAATLVVLTSETASAQFRRGRAGGVGIGIGGPGMYGPGGYGGYGRGIGGIGGVGYGGYGRGIGGIGGVGYGPAWGGSAVRYGSSYSSPSYYGSSYSSPSYYGSSAGYANSGYYGSSAGYSGSSYSSYPSTMTSGTVMSSGMSTSGCCDPCSGGGMSYASGGMTYAPGTTTHSAGYTPASGETGLRVVEVEQQGPAQTAGIVTGSVIESVDGQQVRSFDQLQSAVRSGKDRPLKVTLIDPNGQRRTHDVAVRDNMIGVSVVETQVSFQGQNGSSQPNNNDGTIPQQLPNRTTPDATRPDATRPDSTRPDATRPDATRPDATRPDATRPDTSRPDATRPDATRPDSTRPDATDPARPRTSDPSRPKVDG